MAHGPTLTFPEARQPCVAEYFSVNPIPLEEVWLVMKTWLHVDLTKRAEESFNKSYILF